MTSLTTIFKREAGKSEAYDETKLRASLYASCLAAGAPQGSAEVAARNVCQHLLPWLAQKPEVTSGDIRRIASQHLRAYHPDAADIYKHHRQMI